MVLGRAGLRLEAQKFALYLVVPISASLAFNEPSVQVWAADYFKFMKYPSNPKTNLKDEFEAVRKQREEELEWERRMAEKRGRGREEYMNQLKQLNLARGGDCVDPPELTQRRGWFGWLKGCRRGSGEAEK